MHVEILALDPPCVRVRSPVGEVTATWHGDLPPPGARRSVELGIADELAWGTDAIAVAAQPHVLADAPGGGAVLIATLEAVEDDGAVVLRLGPAIVLLAISGEAPPVGTTVRLVARRLALYDANI